MENICGREGQHRFHVADVVGIPAEGHVVIIALCISCGEVLSKNVKVSEPHAHMFLKSDEQKEKK